jgi:hypothetical protein
MVADKNGKYPALGEFTFSFRWSSAGITRGGGEIITITATAVKTISLPQ